MVEIKSQGSYGQARSWEKFKHYYVFLWEFRNVFDFVLFYKYLYIGACCLCVP